MDYIGNYKDLNQALKNWIDQQRSKGQNVTQEDIKKREAQLIDAYNNAPNPDCHGFTSAQMDDMTYMPLAEGCPVQLRTLTEEQIQQIPIMRQVLHLMNALAQKELKLTVKGNIPIKMVRELYELGVKSWYSDYYEEKVRFSEQRCEEVLILRSVLAEAGLIKKRLGKLSLTERGRKLLKDHNKLLLVTLLYLFNDFDFAYLDPYRDEESGSTGQLYSLWLLHDYGSEWRNVKLYAKDYFRALDTKGISNAYAVRIFGRLFRIIGLCEIQENKKKFEDNGAVKYYLEEEVRKTPLLDMMFTFVEPAKV